MPDYDKLMDVINRTIKPTTWDEVGGCGSIQEYDAANVQSLVVSQTQEIHEEIQQLLDRLRKLQQGPLSNEDIEKLPPSPSKTTKQKILQGNQSGMGGMGMGGMGMMGSGMGGAAPAKANPPPTLGRGVPGMPPGQAPGAGK
jgi:hypothetical protein